MKAYPINEATVRTAVSVFTWLTRIAVPTIINANANRLALKVVISPCGIGRLEVRTIFASIFLSIIWLIVAAEDGIRDAVVSRGLGDVYKRQSRNSINFTTQMSGYVYLIRVGDLYRIGKTDNLEKKIKKLKPDELLTSIMTKEPETLEARLLRKYKSQRIPETGYLKLSKRQIRECKKQFELKGSLPHTLDAEVSITLFASFLLFSLGSFIFNYLNFGFVRSISYSFGMASLPMVILFITGSFGGYFSEDLSLFSLLTNRIKGLFIAIAMLSMAYLIFNLG